jgi:UDP-N-acetylmuramoyl-tripeptide--D-alanyl-D-alanine ligase
MRHLTVKKLHEILGGRLRLATLPPLGGEDARVGHIVTDSRQAQRGEVFWGLSGTRFDGANFAEEAFARGAAGAVVGGRYVQPAPGCWSLEVASAKEALVRLARWNRQRMSGTVVAVTGSVGKTTTRQMIHTVLGSGLCGSTSPRNFNNHVGVPLSMLGMEPEHDYAVLELGASAAGEIGSLAALCQPSIGVLTRVGDAHLGTFGSVEAVAEAKAELITALPPDGWAVLAGDDAQLRRVAAGAKTKIVWCGRSLDNNLVATNIESREGRLSFTLDGMPMCINVWGRHHLTGALSAVAVGRIFGMDDREIARALAEFQSPPMRCQITRVGGATIIDDTYNASPVAMRAALELLRDFDAPGRRIVICGDMRELGEAAEKMHRTLGDQVVTLCGADLLVACGDHAHHVVAGARAAGMPHGRSLACRELDEFLARGDVSLRTGDVVLVKGSRAMAMERLVQSLQELSPCAV